MVWTWSRQHSACSRGVFRCCCCCFSYLARLLHHLNQVCAPPCTPETYRGCEGSFQVLYQRLADFFCKRPDCVIILSFGAMCSWRNHSTLPSQQKSSHGQNGKEYTGMCSNKTSLMDANIWILYDFHMSRNILLILSYHFKIVKIILKSSQRKVGGLINQAPGCSLQFFMLEMRLLKLLLKFWEKWISLL